GLGDGGGEREAQAARLAEHGGQVGLLGGGDRSAVGAPPEGGDEISRAGHFGRRRRVGAGDGQLPVRERALREGVRRLHVVLNVQIRHAVGSLEPGRGRSVEGKLGSGRGRVSQQV